MSGSSVIWKPLMPIYTHREWGNNQEIKGGEEGSAGRGASGRGFPAKHHQRPQQPAMPGSGGGGEMLRSPEQPLAIRLSKPN